MERYKSMREGGGCLVFRMFLMSDDSQEMKACPNLT